MGSERIDLPQGTLDLLILKTLALEPQHGWAVSERIQQISRDVRTFSKAPSIRPCIDSSGAAGSKRNGERRRIIAGPSITSLRKADASSLKQKRAPGGK